MDSSPVEINTPAAPQITQISSPSIPNPRISKDAIRTSLRASTVDGIFAAVFSVSTGAVLLGNFLVELGASPVVFGLVSSIPMVVNLFQPVGAYLSERSTSRFQYSLRTYGIGRLLWLILVIAIPLFSWGWINSQQLVVLSLLIVVSSHLLVGLGNASWLSWLAILVPRQLRGRYFGLRNSIGNFTELISLSVTGLVVSHWYGGSIQGYGVVLFLGIIFGIISLGCQYFLKDINPQLQNTDHNSSFSTSNPSEISQPISALQSQQTNSILQNFNFLVFVIYFGLWTFAVNLSAPFFNLYLLDTLNLDVSWVTFYNSLRAGAHMVMLLVWGKFADKIGNRLILICTGILIAVIPWLWVVIGSSPLDLWLWLPLLHLFIGANWGAIDLCTNNFQIEITPVKNRSIYLATAAAIAGASGAFGATIGGFIAEFSGSFGIVAVFVVSGILRLVSIVPLMIKQTPKNQLSEINC